MGMRFLQSRPGGPAAKRQPSTEGLGPSMRATSAGGAAPHSSYVHQNEADLSPWRDLQFRGPLLETRKD